MSTSGNINNTVLAVEYHWQYHFLSITKLNHQLMYIAVYKYMYYMKIVQSCYSLFWTDHYRRVSNSYYSNNSNYLSSFDLYKLASKPQSSRIASSNEHTHKNLIKILLNSIHGKLYRVLLCVNLLWNFYVVM